MENVEQGKERLRTLMNEVNNPPLVTFSDAHHQLQSASPKKAPQSLPPNVHLLSLEPIISESASRYMIRLEHFFDEGESDEWSTPVHLDLEEFIGSLQLGGPIDWIRETALGGNVRDNVNGNEPILFSVF